MTDRGSTFLRKRVGGREEKNDSHVITGSIARIAGSRRTRLQQFYRAINFFPEYVVEEDDQYTAFGCRQTVVFGTICLGLLLGLSIFYALSKVTVASTVSNPTYQEVSDLFNAGVSPYCECSNPLIRRGSMANISFEYDTLCVEMEKVWPQILSDNPTISYWDQATFRSVLEVLYNVCLSVDKISTERIKSWQNGFFTSLTFLELVKIKQLVEPELTVVQDGIKTLITSIMDVSETYTKSNMPSGYASDAVLMPSPYLDPWTEYSKIKDAHSGSILSISKLASIYKNNTITPANFDTMCPFGLYGDSSNINWPLDPPLIDVQCYFAFWTGKSCQDEFGVMVHIVSDGKLQGANTTSGGLYPFSLDYYCSATQTMLQFPTAALANDDFFQWAGFPSSVMTALSKSSLSQSFFQNVSSALNSAFITNSSITFSHPAYFDSCAPSRCTYIEDTHLSATAIVVLIFGLLGGFVSSLRIIIPIIFLPCAPDHEKHNEEKIAKEMKLMDHQQKPMKKKIKKLEEDVTRLSQVTSRFRAGSNTSGAARLSFYESNPASPLGSPDTKRSPKATTFLMGGKGGIQGTVQRLSAYSHQPSNSVGNHSEDIEGEVLKPPSAPLSGSISPTQHVISINAQAAHKPRHKRRKTRELNDIEAQPQSISPLASLRQPKNGFEDLPVVTGNLKISQLDSKTGQWSKAHQKYVSIAKLAYPEERAFVVYGSKKDVVVKALENLEIFDNEDGVRAIHEIKEVEADKKSNKKFMISGTCTESSEHTKFQFSAPSVNERDVWVSILCSYQHRAKETGKLF